MELDGSADGHRVILDVLDVNTAARDITSRATVDGFVVSAASEEDETEGGDKER
jgi:hypothetical protein